MYPTINAGLNRHHKSYSECASSAPWNQEWGQKVDDILPVYTPPVDISEDERCFHLQVELPGVDPRDITIELSDSSVEVRAEKRNRFCGRNLSCTESVPGIYSRHIDLPAECDADRSCYNYKNGVLTLSIPKKRVNLIRSIRLMFNDR